MTFPPRWVWLLITTVLLSGCGLQVPNIAEPWDGPDGTMQLEFEIKKRVYCELKDAVIEVNKTPFFSQNSDTGRTTQKQFLPDDWGAQVSLRLQVDEAGTLSPGLTLISPLKMNDVSSVALGGILSSTATKVDKYDPFYTIKSLNEPFKSVSVCMPGKDPVARNDIVPTLSSQLISNDLGIKRWLADAMFTNSLLPSTDPAKSSNNPTPDTVTLEVTFVATSSGTVTPTFKLVKVAANPNNTFFSLGRTRTHGLIITIGPQKGQTSQTHFASQIGQSVSGNNRALLLGQ